MILPATGVGCEHVLFLQVGRRTVLADSRGYFVRRKTWSVVIERLDVL